MKAVHAAGFALCLLICPMLSAAPSTDDAAADTEQPSPAPKSTPSSTAHKSGTKKATLIAPQRSNTVVPEVKESTNRSDQVDAFEEQLLRFVADSSDTLAYFNTLRDETRLRLWQIQMALDNASSIKDRATIDPDALEQAHPGFPKEAYQLPDHVLTLKDLYLDTKDLYATRIRVMALLAPEDKARAVGTELYGMQELRSETDFVAVELRYQLMRLPTVFTQIKRMLFQAPIPLIWIFVQIWLAVLVFRWWRRWAPATMLRMRSALLAIRPRSEEILTRLRGLWYFDQVRAPLEWLLLISFVFSVLDFEGLEMFRDIASIGIRWFLLAWFAVAVLNAISARGAGGLAGESARLRLRSMRLVAAWLVMLGLGIDLSTDLVGEGALSAWVWRAYQLLAFPLVIGLLSLWHDELYLRLQREGELEITLEEYSAQKGPVRWLWSAKVAGLLLASWLRSKIMRRIESFDPMRVAGSNNPEDDNEDVEQGPRPISEELHAALLHQEEEGFSKYARLERRELVARINEGVSGIVGVVGERGIGKGGFLRQVAKAHKRETLLIPCKPGDDSDVVIKSIVQQLGLAPDSGDEALNQALREQGVRVIGIYDVHRLVSPVMGGFSALDGLRAFLGRVTEPIVWLLSIDRYAYQYIARARADYQLADQLVELGAWPDELITEFIDERCKAVGLEADFSNVRVPRQYMDTAQDVIEERNKAGLYAMIASLSRGNPAIAIRLFADALRQDDNGKVQVILPSVQEDRFFEQCSVNVLLVLRAIAQSEFITFGHIVDNLRFSPDIVRASLYYAEQRGWIEELDGNYRIALAWFRAITRVLGRQNLLAGVRREAEL